MHRVVCLLALILGIHCSNNNMGMMDLGTNMGMMDLGTGGTGSPDMSMPGPARICSSDAWCWENPLPLGNPLSDIWGADANNAWAVGGSGTIV